MIDLLHTILKTEGIGTDTYIYTSRRRLLSAEKTYELTKINGGNCDG